MELEKTFEIIRAAVVAGDHVKSKDLTKQALEAGAEPLRLIEDALVAGMTEVGDLFERGEYYVPDLLISSRAMQTCLGIVLPQFKGTRTVLGRVVVGSVKGDIHDIGKSIVAVMLESAGFEVIDLGVNVDAQAFVEAVQKHKAQVLGLSALLTTTMPAQRQTIEALEQAGLRQNVKVAVGGAPVSEAWAHDIGADGYAPDAVKAVRLVKSLVS